MIIFGAFHFVSGSSMIGYLTGWPFPLFLIYVSGAGLILGGISIVVNRYARLAAMLLAIEIGIFILTMHLPAVLQGGEGMQMAIGNMLKDVALAGGALLISVCSVNRGLSSK